jgi:hypothetical protein
MSFHLNDIPKVTDHGMQILNISICEKAASARCFSIWPIFFGKAFGHLSAKDATC